MTTVIAFDVPCSRFGQHLFSIRAAQPFSFSMDIEYCSSLLAIYPMVDKKSLRNNHQPEKLIFVFARETEEEG